METVLFELSTFRFVSKTGFIRVYKGRSFPLQVLAFLRGGRRASSCLRGLATPPFPLESSTFRYNPLCSFKQGGIPFDYRLVATLTNYDIV
ncbi:hypothetical protein VL03_06495 [Rossellomorea marisflavi]|nr:hypothetical protein VL03_06495 [Rossellomorea marisflavi]